MAAIEYKGLNAVTNFDLSRYINWIRPGQNGLPSNNPNPPNADPLPSPNNSDHLSSYGFRVDLPESAPPRGAGALASSPLGLLMQSSKFKEMLERTSAEDCPSTSSPESEFPRRSFPDDIHTFFHCNEPQEFAEGDDIIFGDLNSFASPIFHCELDA